jgi:CBS domain-containing protein
MLTNQTVLEAKRYGIIDCHQAGRLGVAAQRMVTEDVSALVVTDEEGYLAGIISRTDLLRALLAHKDWEEQPVSVYMNSDVVSVKPDTTLEEVARLLTEKHIHRVVVVSEEGGKKRPISVVSAADVVYHMVKATIWRSPQGKLPRSSE